LDADAMAKWIAPYGFTCKVHHLDARVGGTFRMSFTNFGTCHSHAFGGTYLELVPDALLRYTDTFEDPNLPGELLVTVALHKVLCGTEVRITQAGYSRGHTGGDVLPGLARVAGAAGNLGGAGGWGVGAR